MPNGYYWFKSERATNKTICQYMNGGWYPTNEIGPISMHELNRRGWTLDKRVSY
jgi:hypothetical protein